MFRSRICVAIVSALLCGAGFVTAQPSAKELIAASNSLYGEGKYKEAIAKLEEASALSPNDPQIIFNIAASYYKLGDRQKAVEYLDRCKVELAGKGDASSVAELRELVSTGETAPSNLSEASRTAIETVNKTLQTSSAPKPEEVTSYADVDAKEQQLRCKILRDNESTLPKTGAVLYNLAKCAEDEGHIEDASKYFNEYLQKAPKSLDAEELQLRASDLASLITLSDASSKQIREHYSNALKLLSNRRYAQALQEYKEAEKLAPDFPQTQFKLGLLYQAMGRVSDAKEHFQRHIKLESREPIRKTTEGFLASLDERKQKYDELIQAAKGQFQRTTQSPQLQMASVDPVVQKLEAAVFIFPLALEANSMLAVAYMHGNNLQAARGPLGVVAGLDSPVFFYGATAKRAEVCGPKAECEGEFAKIELTPKELRIVYLTHPNQSKVKAERRSSPVVATKAGEVGDHLANIAGPSSDILPADLTTDTVIIPATAIKSVRTSEATVFIDSQQAKYAITPKQNTFPKMAEGPVARRYANPYTRLFSQYMQMDQVELGKESLTGMEKVKLGVKIANAVQSIFSAPTNIGALATSIRVMQSVQAASIALSVMQQSRLQNALALQSMQFRVIPSRAIPFAFRLEEFK